MALTIPLNSKHHLIKLILAVAVVILSGQQVRAQPIYQLQYPFCQSAYAGSEIHLFAHHLISELDNRWVPSSLFENQNRWGKTANVLYRLLRIGTYEFYLAYLPVINQHEYFGHLSRAKQMQAQYTRYEIYLFPPSGGRAWFSNHKHHPLTPPERLLEYAGGVEANALMAEKIRSNATLAGSLSFQDVMLYLGASTDFSTYVLFSDNGSYDDVIQYLSVINEEREPDQRIERRDLRLPAILSAVLDPFAIRTTYSLVRHYLLNGETTFQAPALIPVGNFGFMAYYLFEPGAEGLRHGLQGQLLTKEHLYSITLYTPALQTAGSSGIQLNMMGLARNRSRISYDLDLRYWFGSTLSYHDESGDLHQAGTHGALVGCQLHYTHPTGPRIDKDWVISAGLSYKTAGYTKGMPLPSGFLFSVGLGYIHSSH